MNILNLGIMLRSITFYNIGNFGSYMLLFMPVSAYAA